MHSRQVASEGVSSDLNSAISAQDKAGPISLGVHVVGTVIYSKSSS